MKLLISLLLSINVAVASPMSECIEQVVSDNGSSYEMDYSEAFEVCSNVIKE